MNNNLYIVIVKLDNCDHKIARYYRSERMVERYCKYIRDSWNIKEERIEIIVATAGELVIPDDD